MKLSTLFFTIIALIATPFAAMAADCDPTTDPTCVSVEMPECLGCDFITPIGSNNPITVAVSGMVDLKQTLGEVFSLENCLIEGEAWAGQKADGIIQLPSDVDSATGAVAAAAAQLNEAEDSGNVSGLPYTQTMQQFEKFSISAGANQATPEAAISVVQEDTTAIRNEVFGNGLGSNAIAQSCFDGIMYGINPLVSAQGLNQFSYTLGDNSGDWQSASGVISYTINPPPTPTAPAAQ